MKKSKQEDLIMRDDYIYLRHLFDAIEQIETYISGVSKTDFDLSKLIQDAVIHQLTIIGQIAQMVSSDIRENFTEVHWTDIDKMYKELQKNFLNNDTETLWCTIKNDLPHLKLVIERII